MCHLLIFEYLLQLSVQFSANAHILVFVCHDNAVKVHEISAWGFFIEKFIVLRVVIGFRRYCEIKSDYFIFIFDNEGLCRCLK